MVFSILMIAKEFKKLNPSRFLKWLLGGVGAGIGFLIAGPMGAFEGALIGFACGATFDIANGDHSQSF